MKTPVNKLNLVVSFSAIAISLTALFVALPSNSASPALADGQNASALDDNISISAPTRIDYVARPDGTLMLPSSSSLYIQNEGARETRVASVRTSEQTDWNIVDDAHDSELANSASLSVGVSAEQVNASDAKGEDVEVGTNGFTQAYWTMAAADSANADATRVELTASGDVANLDGSEISGPIGTTAWYVVDSTVTNDVYDRLEALENWKDDFLDNTYPVGSIYSSTNSTSPATLFGGTWERIQGRFLLGATDGQASGAAQSAGNTGGEATHTLTVTEMPSHTHVQDAHNHTQNPHSHTLNYTIPANGEGRKAGAASGSYWVVTNPNKDLAINNTTATNNATTATNQYTGGGAAHNNMPPYLSVYMWKRIA